MGHVERTLHWQRLVLAGTVAAAALVYWRGSLDAFNTVKATTILIGFVMVLAIGAVRLLRTRRLAVPRTGAWTAVGALVVARS
jgi:hypothetical protein